MEAEAEEEVELLLLHCHLRPTARPCAQLEWRLVGHGRLFLHLCRRIAVAWPLDAGPRRQRRRQHLSPSPMALPSLSSSSPQRRRCFLLLLSAASSPAPRGAARRAEPPSGISGASEKKRPALFFAGKRKARDASLRRFVFFSAERLCPKNFSIISLLSPFAPLAALKHVEGPNPVLPGGPTAFL